MECGVCWWAYDSAAGDEDGQIPPGTAFDALPETWTCPRCGADKSRFVRPASDAASARDEELVRELSRAFERVEPRMRELPIFNPRLRVEPVGFRRVGDRLIGALVTPWFLNVVVLHDPSAEPTRAALTVSLPGGTFVFEPGREGPAHHALSLLSPVHELADPTAARAVAKEALAVLLERDRPRTREAAPAVSRRALLSGLFGGTR